MSDIEELFKPKCTLPGLCFISHVNELRRMLQHAEQIRKTNDSVSDAILRMVFVRLVETYQVHLVAVFEVCLLANPKSLRSATRIPVEQVLEFEDMDAFLRYLAKRELDCLARSDLKQQVAIYRERLGIDLFNDYRKHEAVRRLITDRDTLLASHDCTDDQSLQGQARVETAGIEAALDLLVNQAARLDQSAIDQHRPPHFNFERRAHST